MSRVKEAETRRQTHKRGIALIASEILQASEFEHIFGEGEKEKEGSRKVNRLVGGENKLVSKKQNKAKVAHGKAG